MNTARLPQRRWAGNNRDHVRVSGWGQSSRLGQVYARTLSYDQNVEEPLDSVRVVHRRISEDPELDEEGRDYSCNDDLEEWLLVDERGQLFALSGSRCKLTSQGWLEPSRSACNRRKRETLEAGSFFQFYILRSGHEIHTSRQHRGGETEQVPLLIATP